MKGELSANSSCLASVSSCALFEAAPFFARFRGGESLAAVDFDLSRSSRAFSSRAPRRRFEDV